MESSTSDTSLSLPLALPTVTVDLFNADCREICSLILADNSIDLIVTSPPYDNLREYNKESTWNFEIFKEIAQSLVSVLKEGGTLVWIVNDAVIEGSETGTSFMQALYFKELGLRLHDTMVWEKDGVGMPSSNRYHSCFEYMFILSKGKPRTFNPIKDRRNKCAGMIFKRTIRQRDGSTIPQRRSKPTEDYSKRLNVWHLQASKADEKNGHPAIYPLHLAKDHILSWSNPGDVVLDPFMGSGTTGLACKNTGRSFIGIEQSAEYFKIAEARINGRQ